MERLAAKAADQPYFEAETSIKPRRERNRRNRHTEAAAAVTNAFYHTTGKVIEVRTDSSDASAIF